MSELPVPVVTPPETPRPQTLVCANCHAELSGEYCASCGQRHEPHIHTVAHFAGEAFESISHADSRLWRTLWYLFARPGFLTREFFAGRRVAYLPPFRLYLVLSVIFFLLAGLSQDEPEGAGSPATRPAITQQTDEERAKAREEALQTAREERQQGIEEAQKALAEKGFKLDADLDGKKVQVHSKGLDEFCKPFAAAENGGSGARARNNIRQFCRRVQEDGSELFTELGHNLPRAMFIFLPLLAGIMKLMYWRPRRYYVEHLLFLVHNHAFVFLMLIFFMLVDLAIYPLIGDYVWPFYVAGSFYTVWYIFRAMRNMYGQHGLLTFLKYFVLGLTYVFTAFFTLLLTLIFLAIAG
jgi:hypothetical protein